MTGMDTDFSLSRSLSENTDSDTITRSANPMASWSVLSDSLSKKDCKEVEETLKVIHSQTKGVVGMKVLAEGHLREKVDESIRYVRNLPFIDSFFIGMTSRDEITENCRSLESR